ncbi:MAG: hypothetical protein M5U28_28305 [Sandaracinaceae bacterium]|nr:hypothetical protein [Sandaracinaceae bacterium]
MGSSLPVKKTPWPSRTGARAPCTTRIEVASSASATRRREALEPTSIEAKLGIRPDYSLSRGGAAAWFVERPPSSAASG